MTATKRADTTLIAVTKRTISFEGSIEYIAADVKHSGRAYAIKAMRIDGRPDLGVYEARRVFTLSNGSAQESPHRSPSRINRAIEDGLRGVL